jgi:hypothetical protein
VKFFGKKYADSQWIPKPEVFKFPEARTLLNKYLRKRRRDFPGGYLYDPLYDQLDTVLMHIDDKYLVLWSGLGFDSLSWETDLLDIERERFESRLAAGWPLRDPEAAVVPSSDVSLISEMDNLDDREVYTVNTLISAFRNGDDFILVDDFGFQSRQAAFGFLRVLQSAQIHGPFLIVADDLSRWREFARECPDLLTIFYDGEETSRVKIREVYFDTDDEIVPFNVLVVDPPALARDATVIGRLRYRVAIYHSPLARTLSRSDDRIRIDFAVAISEVDPADRADAITTLCSMQDSRLVSRQLYTQVKEVIESFQPALERVLKHPDPAFVAPLVYSVRCPMTAIQQSVCESLLAMRNEDVQGTAQKILRVCSHPFIVDGIEHRLGNTDFVEASTKLMVLDALVELCADNGDKVVIVTEFQGSMGLIGDLFQLRGYPFHICTDREAFLDERHVYIFNPRYADVVPPFEVSTAVVIFEGPVSAWNDIVTQYRRPKAPLFKVAAVYFLECVDCCETLLTDPASLDLASTATALHSLSSFPVGPIDLLINGRRPVEDGHDPLPAAPPDFWDGLTFRDLPAPADPVPLEWTIHRRNQLARGLAQFGFGRWAAIREGAGLFLPDATISLGACFLIRQVLDVSDEPARYDALARLIDVPDGASAIAVSAIDVFGQDDFPRELAQSTFLKRIDKLLYHPRPVDDSQPGVVHLSAGALTDWWNDDHDRALLFLSWHHGLGIFDHVAETPEVPACKLFLSLGDVPALSPRQLTERVLAFCDAAKKEVVPDDALVESLVCDDAKWSSEDQAIAITHLLKFGVERDDDGDPDYYLFMRGSGLTHRREPEVRKFIEKLLYKCDHPETAEPVISYKTAISLTQRVAQMSNLRVLFEQDDRDVRQFFGSAPRWRNLPKQWTSDHEMKYFRALMRFGFGSLGQILEEPAFAELFGQNDPPGHLLSDDAVMKRISILDDHRRHPKARPKKAKKDRDESKVAAAAAAGSTPNWDEIWNDGDVRLPLEIRPNCELLDLGHVVTDRPHFHTERYIYPAGYKTTRSFWSTQHINDRVVWVSEIIDTGGPRPLFKVYIEDNPKVSFEGATTSQPWVTILKTVSAKKREKHSNTISGPMAYGLDRPIVQRLIQHLPGARQCSNYIWMDFKD